MSVDLTQLLSANRQWAEKLKSKDPSYFEVLANQQSPQILWIGCSDSRVPANQLLDLPPGEVFVHRNIANQVIATDLNCMAVLEYAIDVLQVKHVIITGHYGCGGVAAALGSAQYGIVDCWLRGLRDLHEKHRDSLRLLKDEKAKVDRLCELNVIEQVNRICHTPIVQRAWQRQQQLTIHGWIYSVRDGLLHDMQVSVNDAEHISEAYRIGEPLALEV